MMMEEGANKRELIEPWNGLTKAVALAAAVFYLYTSLVGQFGPEYHRGIFVLATVVMIFFLYPAGPRSPKDRPSAFDLVLVLLTFLSIGYWIVEYTALVYRVGDYLPRDFWIGALGLVICLEAGRRVTGWLIPVLGGLAILYGLLGGYIPGLFAHRGFTIKRLVEYIFLTSEGLFGVMAEVLPSYVLLFLLLGAFLNISGVGKFFIDLPMALAGKSLGGPAKVAVVASGLFGSINGSVLANTVSTGSLTIPLMKRVGYRPHVAAAVETIASTGGQILPPVMGAGAFIMVELTNVPYTEIIKVAAIPGILFYLSLFVIVHLEAKRSKIPTIPASELPRFGAVLRGGWFFVTPFVVLLYLLYEGYSPNFSAFWTIAAVVAVSWFRRDTRMGPRQIVNACVEGMMTSLSVGSLMGAIGIFIGIVVLTAAGLKFSHALIGLSGGNLFLALTLVGVAALALGMGMPITAAYLLLAVLAAPALKQMGANLLAAHLAIFWLSQDSNMTPPVCLGAYAAAGIANANPWRTGITAFRFGLILLVMPYLFLYGHILLNGTWLENLWAVVLTTLGVIAFSAWTMFHALEETTKMEWVLLGFAWIAMVWPAWQVQVAGFAMGLLFLFMQWTRRRTARARMQAAQG
jgi:TRAP transporter 4TM/12TM fusion protein